MGREVSAEAPISREHIRHYAPMTRVTTGAAFAVSVFLLMGCGGGSSSSAASTGASSSAVESPGQGGLCQSHQPPQAAGLKVALSTGAVPASLVVQEIEQHGGDPSPWNQVPPDHLVENCVYTSSGALALPGSSDCSVDVYLDADGRVSNADTVAGASCPAAN
jgi:hypothetical protein